ncbi:MAG: FKBP-type peptidyl-prolyl cis-trans isomerase [Bacteroidales bacterium]|jgi:FKBP-type peptidyl-prolyl cis-trans isomerase|nr:FKBP-type peptidyl-prolyl cis-trans isomerase [Bacteroidales bacterium]
MKNIYIPLLVTFLVCIACSKDDSNTSWKDENEAFFHELATRSDLNKIEAGSKGGVIYYRVIQSGSPDQPSPIYNGHAVDVFYRGVTLLGFDKQHDAIVSGKEFDTTFKPANLTGVDTYAPVRLQLTSVIEGWREALQRMKKGDKWQIYIPWQLGYKDQQQSAIPAYSTLIFEIELISIYEL